MEWLKIVIPLLVLLATGIGYLLRRFVEGRRVDETLERHRKALDLKNAMDAAGVTPETLNSFTAAVMGRQKLVRSREDAVSVELTDSRSLEIVTQAEMNNVQQARAEAAALVLEKAEIEYADELERDEAARLRAAMDAWEVLVENHAQLASLSFREGSMAPLAYWAERERMTTTRIAEIQTLTSERRAMNNSRYS